MHNSKIFLSACQTFDQSEASIYFSHSFTHTLPPFRTRLSHAHTLVSSENRNYLCLLHWCACVYNFYPKENLSLQLEFIRFTMKFSTLFTVFHTIFTSFSTLVISCYQLQSLQSGIRISKSTLPFSYASTRPPLTELHIVLWLLLLWWLLCCCVLCFATLSL